MPPVQQPVFLKDATKFQAHAHELHGLWVIETLQKYVGHPKGDLLAPLEEATQKHLGRRYGRDRLPGKWYLAYLAFVFSRQPDVRPWWQSAGHSIWTSAGFKERPTYATVQRRFAELEHPRMIQAFEAAAAKLIVLAHDASGGEVGRFLHVDATEAETHARLIHVCPANGPCDRRARAKKKAEAKARAVALATADPSEAQPGYAQPAWDEAARVGTRVTAGESINNVRAERHEHAADPEPEDQTSEDTEIGDADMIVRSETGVLVRVGGCLYELPDPTAGIRAYVRDRKVKRFWAGFYNAKAIDHYTGAPVAVRITSASTNEFVSYPDLLAGAINNTGRLPEAVVGDRGYSVSRVFEHNTRLGIGSVFAWRAAGPRTKRELEDCDLHDRHGVPRCRHCGGPTSLVSFARTAGGYGRAGEQPSENGDQVLTEINGEQRVVIGATGATKKVRGPRLYVQCSTPTQPGCEKRQSVACEKSWRMLVPLWRTDPVYLALRHSHDRYERVHHHWRVRWRSGADDHALRPKRRGLECQQLRANAALMVEWLMICWREQWLPGDRPRGVPDPSRLVVDDGTDRAAALERYRNAKGLNHPYGPAAVATKLGDAEPAAGPTPAGVSDPTEEPETHPSENMPLDPDPAIGDILNAAEVDPEHDLPF